MHQPDPGGRPLNERLHPGLVPGYLLGICQSVASFVGGRSQSGTSAARTTGDVARARADDPGATGRSGALPYLPAIDGLRALAVTAVLLYHAEIGAFRAGFIGVDIFFVISGFLITSLLLAERSASGKVSIAGFWRRRARRLLPAAFTLIIGTLLYTVIFLPDEVSALRGDALASLGYVTNWYLIFEDQSYFETLARPSLLQHLWSLAVEEQFYLLFPPVFALVLGRLHPRYAVAIILAGAAASAALMAVLYEPGVDTSRIYYGTDTRIAGILIGSALAFFCRPGAFAAGLSKMQGRLLDAAGLAALAGLMAVSLLATETGSFLYLGGFVAVSALAAVLIAAAVHPGAAVVQTVLSRRPLVWLGTRSYSIYLWHWPVFMLTRPGQDVEMDGAGLFAVRIAITLVLAELSFRLVETPVRNGSLGKLWQSMTDGARAFSLAEARRLMATGFAGGISVFLAFSIAAADPPPPPMGLEVDSVQISSWSTDGPTASASATEKPSSSPRQTARPTASAKPTAEPTPEPTAVASATPGPTASATAAPETAPPTAEPPAPTVPPLPTPVDGPRVFALGDSVMLGAASALAASIGNLELDAAVSRQVWDGINILSARRNAGLLGDVVIIHLGTNGAFRADDLTAMMEVLVDVPRVIFMTVSVPLGWEGPNNEVIRSAASYSNAVVADWKSLASGHPDIFGSDGVHVGPTGASYYANLIAPLIVVPE